MIVAGPGVPSGVMVKNLTSLLDVFPTLVEMQGGLPKNYLDGFSLMPFLKPGSGSAAGPRNDFVVSQYHSNMGNTGSFMIRQGPWKYIAFGQNGHRFNGSCGEDCTYKPQLFNPDTDPDEIEDVAAKNPDVVSQLDKLLSTQIDYQAVDREAKLSVTTPLPQSMCTRTRLVALSYFHPLSLVPHRRVVAIAV